jgi:Flp pilus assembly protein CpaB
MTPRTLVLMFVAIGCGLTAAYMTSHMARQDADPAAVTRGEVVPVIVARMSIAAGTAITDPAESFKVVHYLKGDEPEGALSRLEVLKRRVVQRPLAEDQPVKESDLAGK